ncbi:MAG: ABC-type transporter Mla subunit MlaD [Limisphaerales bacterium]|jgi:ABC-type transporter Mla subunit MlaD
MALHDLTPNLRTRLNRVEHAVGFFVLLAVVLLLSGFCYYVYYTAKTKGWYDVKAPFFSYIDSATGLHVGDAVMMMGFEVGTITKITADPAGSPQNVYLEFVVQGEYIGYMWTDSKVRLSAGDLLGNRGIEVLKGNWSGTWMDEESRVVSTIYKQAEKTHKLTEIVTAHYDAEAKTWAYTNYTPGFVYYMKVDEAPALTERAGSIVAMAETAMPSILSLTNQVQETLNVANLAMSNLNLRISQFEPILTNVNSVVAGFVPASSNISMITRNLTNAHGGLGQWLLPTNLTAETELTLTSVRETLAAATMTLTNASTALAQLGSTVGNTDTNLAGLMNQVGESLNNLALITSNLNAQVNSNTNILSEISGTIRHTDEFVQGMKRFWLFRGTFKKKKK